MINWRELTNDEQIAALQNVAGAKHIPPQAVEKDLWVTKILQIVFSMPFADSLVFKGGTSLSKVFGKIERFSEDIDLAIDRTYFGLEGDLTKKQLKKLRKQSSTFVRDTFLGELQEAFRQVFTSMRDVDYTPDVRKRIVLVPPADFMKEWRDDYEAMRSTMVFGPSLAFNALIERLHLLEERFHQ